MPNKPKTPTRSVRVPDERWEPAVVNTRRNGTTVTAVINEALETYNKKHGTKENEHD